MTNIEKIINSIFGLVLNNNDNAANYVNDLAEYAKEQKRLKETIDTQKTTSYTDKKPLNVLLTEFADLINKLVESNEANKEITTTTTEAPTTTTTRAPKPSQSNLIPIEFKKKFRECADQYTDEVLSKEIKEECLLDKIADGLYEYTCWLYTDAQ